jgi:ATP-dependent RNA helicase DeaD
VESLADEFDPVEIAMAAVKLADEASGTADGDGAEIPAPAPVKETGRRERRPAREAKAGRARPGAGVTRLWIGAGRQAGVRPQDLVGAITGEAGITGREIGAIDIADRFSIVEVAEDVAGEVVDALRGSTIKGARVTVRRNR